MPDGGARPDCAPGDSPQARLTSRRQEGGKNGSLLSPAVEFAGQPSPPVESASPRHPDWRPGDNRRPRLCTRRQPACQTVHPATRRETDCASGDNQRSFRAARCRQMHSLVRGLSPGAQSRAVGELAPRGSPGIPHAAHGEGACGRPTAIRRHGILRLRSPSARSAQDDMGPQAIVIGTPPRHAPRRRSLDYVRFAHSARDDTGSPQTLLRSG